MLVASCNKFPSILPEDWQELQLDRYMLGATVGVRVSVGVFVGIGVLVGVGVAAGPNIRPGAQLDMAKLKSKTNIIAVRCLVFISSPALSRAHPAATQSEPHNV